MNRETIDPNDPAYREPLLTSSEWRIADESQIATEQQKKIDVAKQATESNRK